MPGGRTGETAFRSGREGRNQVTADRRTGAVSRPGKLLGIAPVGPVEAWKRAVAVGETGLLDPLEEEACP